MKFKKSKKRNINLEATNKDKKKAPVKKAPVNKPPVKKITEQMLHNAFFKKTPAEIEEEKKQERIKQEKEKSKTKALFKNKNDIDDFYKTVNTFLSNNSKRQFNYVINKGLTRDEVSGLQEAKKYNDFYTTPQHCIRLPQIESVIKNSKNILEPSAGIGHIVNEIIDINPKIKVNINELNENNFEILKKIYPKETITNRDFFKLPYKQYDVIFMNPPFNKPGNKNFYLDFILEGLKLLNKNKSTNYKHLIAIVPFLADKKDNFDLQDLLRAVSGAKKKRLLDVYNIKDIEFTNASLLMTCEGFGGTKFSAGVYLFQI